MNEQKTVFVGLSGGVDSSVAALRLKSQGYNVVGVFIKVWHPDWLKCNWEAERLDAMRVAAKLDIPFLTCDAEADYRDEVAHYFIESYKAGFTPNPDVLCNQYVKFGAFLRFAQQKGADFVATGHYARKEIVGETHQMLRGLDKNKDQTYFLWALNQEQLKMTLFPVGDTPKEKIRQEAKHAGLLTSEKKDSQGVCFLGHIDIREFLSHYTELTPGEVLDTNGKVIGGHEGAIVYTIGQRHGFTINTKSTEEKPHFVVAKDIDSNTITVAPEKPQLEQGNLISLIKTNWNHRTPEIGEELSIQIRYRQTPITAAVREVGEGNMVMELIDDTDFPANGQSCVCYVDDICLGGGIIVTA